MKQSLLLLALVLLTGWLLTDLWLPRRVDLRQFVYREVARLDAAMWRSYYERKPLRLYWQSAELIRKQLRAPFWRSLLISYHAAHAAFVFKDGKNRRDYQRALPDLELFYGAIGQLSTRPLDVSQVARNELEWWIIRRERARHPPSEWAGLQAQIAADVYCIQVSDCLAYGHLRTEAMLYRDQKGAAITEADWQRIESLLEQSWQSLASVIENTGINSATYRF